MKNNIGKFTQITKFSYVKNGLTRVRYIPLDDITMQDMSFFQFQTNIDGEIQTILCNMKSDVAIWTIYNENYNEDDMDSKLWKPFPYKNPELNISIVIK